MTEGVAIALIGGGVSLVIAILVPYINYRMKKQEEVAAKRESECEQRVKGLEDRVKELEKDNALYAQYYIQATKKL